ncbi:MAG: malonyl-CoA decarboxylase family protein [Acidimicrobiales bacterium]
MALRRVRATARAGFEEATARWRRRPRPGNELNERERQRLRDKVEACLDPRLSGVAIRNRAGEVADVVVSLDRNGLLEFFRLLLESFGPDTDKVQRALDDTADVLTPIRGGQADAAAVLDAVAALRLACAPRWEQLFELLCGLRGGVKLTVDLRAELLQLRREHPELAPLDTDLQQVLSRVFPPGLLELRRITWDSPGSLLEKLIDYEAVHEITSWDDLKNRLDDHDRRCYAFIHPGMPDEPLIFVEVALVEAIATDVAPLLDISAPSGAGHEATTAIFYSISACQPGLAGVNLGDVLIKEVVADLSRDSAAAQPVRHPVAVARLPPLARQQS